MDSDKEAVQIMKDMACNDLIIETFKALRTAKPEDRSEKARYYAVAITEMEKVMAYFHTYIVIDEPKK